jgi:CheY-like chemotaxis protein
MPEHPLEILLVEDNPNDVMIARRALTRGLVQHRLSVVRDGQEALDFLFRRGNFADVERAPRPDLILLDLNLPRVDGFEVLRAIKSDAQLRRIPVIMLTTSEREEDVTNSYVLGANTFISKPVEFDRFLNIIRVLHEYWGQVAKLPSNPP